MAREAFKEGYNCAQCMAIAFADVLGMDETTAKRLTSSFGGGMGRMREVCGAVSGMFMVAGVLWGYDDPKDTAGKKETYALIQELAKKYKEEENDELDGDFDDYEDGKCDGCGCRDCICEKKEEIEEKVEEFKDEVKDKVEDTKEKTEKVGKTVAEEAKKVGKTAEKSAKKVAKKAEKEVKKVAKKAEKGAEKVKKTIEHA